MYLATAKVLKQVHSLQLLKTNKQNQQQQTKKQSLCIHSVYECTAVIYIFTCLKVQVFSWDKSKWFFPCRVWLSLNLLPNPGSEAPSELQEAGALGRTPSQMALKMLQLSSSKSLNNMIISGKWQGTKTNVPPFVPFCLLACYLVYAEHKPFQAKALGSHTACNTMGP